MYKNLEGWKTTQERLFAKHLGLQCYQRFQCSRVLGKYTTYSHACLISPPPPTSPRLVFVVEMYVFRNFESQSALTAHSYLHLDNLPPCAHLLMDIHSCHNLHYAHYL